MYNNKCIICNSFSNGKPYCLSCYNKFIRKVNPEKSEFDLSAEYDKYHNKKYRCKNGVLVRSKSEMIISNYLTERGIKNYYEKEKDFIIVDENDTSQTITLRPDFYIPEFTLQNGRKINDIYLEHFGVEDDEIYNKIKLKKLVIYKGARFTLICTSEQDIYDPYRSLTEKFTHFHQNTINYAPDILSKEGLKILRLYKCQ